MEMALQTTLAITSNNSSNSIFLILVETMVAMMAELDIRERTFTRKKSRSTQVPTSPNLMTALRQMPTRSPSNNPPPPPSLTANLMRRISS